MESIRQNLRPVPFNLTGHDRNGFSYQSLDLRFLLAQHIDGTAGVKSSDDYIDTCRPELPGQVKGPWKLVGLDTHQPYDDLGRRATAPTYDFLYWELFCGLVKCNNFDF